MFKFIREHIESGVKNMYIPTYRVTIYLTNTARKLGIYYLIPIQNPSIIMPEVLDMDTVFHICTYCRLSENKCNLLSGCQTITPGVLNCSIFIGTELFIYTLTFFFKVS